MTTFVAMMHQLHRCLDEADVPHAFGGALALAWCVEQARGTLDIDLNLFVDAAAASGVFDALPDDVTVSDKNRVEIGRDGQTRLRWEAVPVDVFFNTTPFHEAASRRVRWEEFAGVDLPFLDCNDLAVFKAFFNRSKDWIDIETMFEGGTLVIDEVIAVLREYLGADDERIAKLDALRSS